MQETTCTFFGHRKITETEKLIKAVREEIENLIVNERVDTFLFGSKSQFDSLCYDIVTEFKNEKYPHIKRIYVRAEYPYIHDNYKNLLLKSYEDTYYPEHIFGAGSAVYVERNFEMIEKSKFCIVYFNEDDAPKARKSGTKIAFDYAKQKGKTVKMITP